MDTKTTEKITVSETPAGTVQTQTVSQAQVPNSDFFVSKTNQVIFAFIGIIDLLLVLRIIFLLLGANQVGVVSFLLSFTQLFVAPFLGIFPSPSAGASYLDVASIVAIIIYLVIGYILGLIINLFSTKTE
jgi:hypothetical protein